MPIFDCHLTRRGFIGSVTSAGALLAASGSMSAGQQSTAAGSSAPASAGNNGETSGGKKPPVLFVVAHADDLEYDMGGLAARFVAEGHDVYRAACSDSAKGTMDRTKTIEKMARIGIAEAVAAGDVLRLKDNFLLGFPDGLLDQHEAEIGKELMRIIRRVRPNTVVQFDPWALVDDHPDHAIAARAARLASEFAAFPLFYPDQLDEKGAEPHFVTERYYFSKNFYLTDEPDPRANRIVDVTAYMDRRVEALLKYESQMRLAYDNYLAYQKSQGVPREKWPKRISDADFAQVLANTVRRDAHKVAELYGKPFQYAEAYRYKKNEPRYP